MIYGQITISVVVGRLRIANPFPEEADFQGVIPINLCERIAHIGHVFIRVQPLRIASGLEAPGIEDQSGLSRVAKGWNLFHAVVEQPAVAVAYLGAIDLGRIGEYVGEADKGVSNDGFVSHRRTEHVGHGSRPRVRLISALNR